VTSSVRIGILGCARIAPAAIVRPAKRVVGAEVTAVGSRDLGRATAFARKHGIPRAYGSYEEVLADTSVDAVYVPLPNSLHAPWTLRAFERGKHVLCEKPLAISAAEAATMAEAAGGSGLVAMEAFHYRYHPMFNRMQAIVESGELGETRRIDAALSFPLPSPRDIRWDPALGGGASLDAGCYVVSAARALACSEPDVRAASGRLTRRGVDSEFRATLAFPGGAEAEVVAGLMSLPRARVRVRGTKGGMSALNPFAPHVVYSRLTVEVAGSRRRERIAGRTTYTHQLEAFVAAVRHRTPFPTTFDDSIRTLKVLDTVRSIMGVTTRYPR
jgi:predicted dehydrogenase